MLNCSDPLIFAVVESWPGTVPAMIDLIFSWAHICLTACFAYVCGFWNSFFSYLISPSKQSDFPCVPSTCAIHCVFFRSVEIFDELDAERKSRPGTVPAIVSFCQDHAWL